MSKIAKKRREALFRYGKPNIRLAVYDDIRWCWAAARREGYEGNPEEFTETVEGYLSNADRVYVLEDKNKEHRTGFGPVGIVLANYDGWALCPHVEWFPWATKGNILRCSVGFLQQQRYTHDVGCIKITTETSNDKWFKWLKRYVAISLAGRIPHGRESGDEVIFYLRGRKHHGRNKENALRGKGKREIKTTDSTKASGSDPNNRDTSGEQASS